LKARGDWKESENDKDDNDPVSNDTNNNNNSSDSTVTVVDVKDENHVITLTAVTSTPVSSETVALATPEEYDGKLGEISKVAEELIRVSRETLVKYCSPVLRLKRLFCDDPNLDVLVNDFASLGIDTNEKLVAMLIQVSSTKH
jgi:hypothetical protein